MGQGQNSLLLGSYGGPLRGSLCPGLSRNGDRSLITLGGIFGHLILVLDKGVQLRAIKGRSLRHPGSLACFELLVAGWQGLLLEVRQLWSFIPFWRGWLQYPCAQFAFLDRNMIKHLLSECTCCAIWCHTLIHLKVPWGFCFLDRFRAQAFKVLPGTGCHLQVRLRGAGRLVLRVLGLGGKSYDCRDMSRSD